MEQKLDLILEKLEDVNSRLNENTEEIKQVKLQLDANTEEIKQVKSQLDVNTKEIKLLKIQLTEMNQLDRAIFDRQEETDAKLESLTYEVHNIYGEISSLKAGQERQNRILASLSLRSLEQETELRELKSTMQVT